MAVSNWFLGVGSVCVCVGVCVCGGGHISGGQVGSLWSSLCCHEPTVILRRHTHTHTHSLQTHTSIHTKFQSCKSKAGAVLSWHFYSICEHAGRCQKALMVGFWRGKCTNTDVL